MHNELKPTTTSSLRELAQRIDEQFSCLHDVVGSVLGGSVARNFCDGASDIEMEVFYENALPSKRAIRTVLDDLGAKLNRSRNLHWNHPAWGFHTFFSIDGVNVELGYRCLTDTIARMLTFRNHFQLPIHGDHDTPFGYYESGLASYLRESIVMSDKNGRIAELLDLVRTFPRRLKKETVAYYFEDAKKLLNVKLRQSVRRNDTFQFHACMARILRSLNVCVFALNDTYFPGDKWNENYLREFENIPQDYLQRMERIFSIPDVTRADKHRKLREAMLVMKSLSAQVSSCINQRD